MDIILTKINNSLCNNTFEELKKEFMDKYWSKDIIFEQAAAENDPHVTLPT